MSEIDALKARYTAATFKVDGAAERLIEAAKAWCHMDLKFIGTTKWQNVELKMEECIDDLENAETEANSILRQLNNLGYMEYGKAQENAFQRAVNMASQLFLTASFAAKSASKLEWTPDDHEESVAKANRFVESLIAASREGGKGT